MLPQVREYVLPESMIYTDEYIGVQEARQARATRTAGSSHSARVYVEGDIHTQTIDGFFGLFKNGVRGVHHGVSQKWLQGYLNEYAWRYNRRDNGRRCSRPDRGGRLATFASARRRRC